MLKAVVLGTFDGVHIGHRAVIDLAYGYDITAVTFKTPPKFFKSETKLLMSDKDRFCALRELGVKSIKELDFAKVKGTCANTFLEDIYKEFSPDLICCGFNYKLGSDLKDKDAVAEFCKGKNIKFSYAQKVEKNGKTVSSSSIREMLENGEISKANELLYMPFGFTAKVVSGNKRGRTLGFPTANTPYPKDLVKLKFGVYESEVIVDGKVYKAISDIGIRPTFKTDDVFAETHIFDFSSDLYGKEIRLNPKRFIRDEKKFKDENALKEAVLSDIKSVFG
ncbi:MAG: riboflavin biosynthesis protein RibF [Clostridia bacterium]|nr:riboflavin biosynthesis protein RibF [Clostridia bacterium]